MEITLKIDGIDVVANSVESGEMNWRRRRSTRVIFGRERRRQPCRGGLRGRRWRPPPGWLVAVIETAEAEAVASSPRRELGAAVDGEPASDGNRSDDIECRHIFNEGDFEMRFGTQFTGMKVDRRADKDLVHA